MTLNSSEWISLISILVSILLAIGNVLFTIWRTKVKGAKFRFVDVYVESLNVAEYKNEGKKTICRIRTTPMNIGDEKGYLKLNHIELQIETSKGRFSTNSTSLWNFHPAAQVKIKITDKVFVFIFDEQIAEIGWTKGKLILEGHYIDHAGKRKNYMVKYEGTNRINKVWKLVYASWWKQKKK
ncbi:MAG: hypothetical protein ACTSP3_05030 [Candidatus Heimdallarchaeaceae archaeon]